MYRDTGGMRELAVNGFGHDIADRKQAESQTGRDIELADSPEKDLRDALTVAAVTVVETSDDAIYLKDLEGRYTMVNLKFANMMGLAREEMIGAGPEAVYSGKLLEQVKDDDRTVLTKGVVLDSEYHIETVDRPRTFMSRKAPVRDEADNIVGLLGISRDITDRRAAQLEVGRLAQEDGALAEIGRVVSSSLDVHDVYEQFGEHVRALVPADRIDIVTFDIAEQTLRVEYTFGIDLPAKISRRGFTRRLAGSIAEEIVRRQEGIVFGSGSVEELRREFPQGVHTYEQGMRSFAVVPLKSKGQVVGMLSLMSAQESVYTEKELKLLERVSMQIAGAIANAQLYRERLQAESALRDSNIRLEEAVPQLRQTQDQIVQQERLRALGTMASGVAHDINNALGPIVGYSDLLLASPETRHEEKAIDYLQAISIAAKDAAEVVSRLSEFYRHREDDDVMVPVSLNEVVRRVISLTQPRWKDMSQGRGVNIILRSELANDLPTVQGNESGLRSALTNLIFNSVDAMPDGGSITISTRVQGHRVVVEVADTGEGMSEETRQRVLEPFFTTKGEGGSGLGLAMVYGITERHGGEIEMRSTVGKGTAVALCFPLDTRQARPKTKPSSDRPVAGLQVLVADDDPLIPNPPKDVLGDSP